ncbi:MAG: GNAT family N-acetyltransferase [Candidatus Eremiobacteraeota bacterium]|nr:GNAT family N-acetyltransferase [Candidatus Eremiobacteraeota bacterium]
MRRILTERLVLEPVVADNAAILWRIMQSGGLREYQDVPRYTREEFRKRVAARPRRFDSGASGRFEWLIVPATTHQAVGWVSLRVGDHRRGAAEIGYSILAPFRGGGLATEAARAIVDFAFRDSDLRQVDACCVPENVASRRLLAKAGFAEIRIQKNGAIVRGRPVDIVIFEAYRDDWLAQASSANSIETPASANAK